MSRYMCKTAALVEEQEVADSVADYMVMGMMVVEAMVEEEMVVEEVTKAMEAVMAE